MFEKLNYAISNPKIALTSGDSTMKAMVIGGVLLLAAGVYFAVTKLVSPKKSRK